MLDRTLTGGHLADPPRYTIPADGQQVVPEPTRSNLPDKAFTMQGSSATPVEVGASPALAQLRWMRKIWTSRWCVSTA